MYPEYPREKVKTLPVKDLPKDPYPDDFEIVD
jgi:hypothetical protein